MRSCGTIFDAYTYIHIHTSVQSHATYIKGPAVAMVRESGALCYRGKLIQTRYFLYKIIDNETLSPPHALHGRAFPRQCVIRRGEVHRFRRVGVSCDWKSIFHLRMYLPNIQANHLYHVYEFVLIKISDNFCEL